jgi:hypothetical protein
MLLSVVTLMEAVWSIVVVALHVSAGAAIPVLL